MLSVRHRFRYIILIVVFILSITTSCNLKHEDEAEPLDNSEKSPGEELQSWQKDTTPIKLDWYIHESWYNKKWDAKRTLFDKTVTEKTGVDINIITPASSGNEKLIAMSVSNEMPDILTISNWNGIRTQMIHAGDFAPLNTLGEYYAPELLSYVPDSMKQWQTQEDGSWYGISNYFTSREWLEEGNAISNANGVMARSDIMDILGILPSDFNTQDSTIAVLKRVKEANLTHNGMKVLPFYTQWNDWAMARMWGIPWEDEKGNWVDYKVHPKYLEMYHFLNRLWREGLIAEDNFTTWSGDKIMQGIVFAYMGNFDDVVDPMTYIYNIDNQITYVPVGPIHASDDAMPLYDQAGTGWTSTYISKASTAQDRAVRLLAFLMSDEGQMLTWYGLEGQTYNLVNDKVRFTNEYLRMRKEDPVMASEVYGFEDFWPLKQSTFDQRFIDTEALPQERKNYNALVDYFSQFSVNTPETMGVGPNEGTVESGISVRIEEYWQKQLRRMILAESEDEVTAIYNESIAHIDNLGYQRVYEATNKVFQEQKKKMNKIFSYPLK